MYKLPVTLKMTGEMKTELTGENYFCPRFSPGFIPVLKEIK